MDSASQGRAALDACTLCRALETRGSMPSFIDIQATCVRMAAFTLIPPSSCARDHGWGACNVRPRRRRPPVGRAAGTSCSRRMGARPPPPHVRTIDSSPPIAARRRHSLPRTAHSLRELRVDSREAPSHGLRTAVTAICPSHENPPCVLRPMSPLADSSRGRPRRRDAMRTAGLLLVSLCGRGVYVDASGPRHPSPRRRHAPAP